jgi:hypothetical protein
MCGMPTRSLTSLTGRGRKPLTVPVGSRSERILAHRIGVLRGNSMQKFFFDMKDGVPHRDTVGIEFKTNAEAIGHCREIAQHFRDESLRDDQDLEICVVNALGREIHREFVHRE